MHRLSTQSFFRNINCPIPSQIQVIKNKKYGIGKLNDNSLKNGTLSSCPIKIIHKEPKFSTNNTINQKQKISINKLQPTKYETVMHENQSLKKKGGKGKLGKENKHNDNTGESRKQSNKGKINYVNRWKPVDMNQKKEKALSGTEQTQCCYPVTSLQSYRYKSMDVDEHCTIMTQSKHYLRSISYNKIKQKNKIIQQYKHNSRCQSNPILTIKHQTRILKYQNKIYKNKCSYPNTQDANSGKSVHQLVALHSPKTIMRKQSIINSKNQEFIKKRKRRFLTEVSQKTEQHTQKMIDQDYVNQEISSIIDQQCQLDNEMKCKGFNNQNRSSIEQCSILQNIKQIQSMLSNHKNNDKDEQPINNISQNINKNRQTNYKGRRQFRILTIDPPPKHHQPQNLPSKKQNKLINNNKNHIQSLPTLQSIQSLMHHQSSKKKTRMLNKCNSIIMRSIDKLKGIFPIGFFQDTVQVQVN